MNLLNSPALKCGKSQVGNEPIMKISKISDLKCWKDQIQNLKNNWKFRKAVAENVEQVQVVDVLRLKMLNNSILKRKNI